MKINVIILMIISVLTLWAQDSKEYKIVAKNSNHELTIEELAKHCSKYDVVFFGEFHENQLLHKLEIQLLENCWKYSPKLAVSLEMFERDTQSFINQYLEDKISEEEMLKNSRPWDNYQTDYKPLIEFAKNNKLPVIAANVPRIYANQVNRNGVEAFDKFPEKQFAAQKLIVKEGEYQKKFYKTMQKMSHGSPMMKQSMDEEKLYNLYAAQSLKDDTMAESIDLFLQKNNNYKVIHFNGDFHSNSHLGTVEKLQEMNTKRSLAVITPILSDEGIVPESRKNEADFFIIISDKQ